MRCAEASRPSAEVARSGRRSGTFKRLTFLVGLCADSHHLPNGAAGCYKGRRIDYSRLGRLLITYAVCLNHNLVGTAGNRALR
jgi:hypothetical protein